VDDKPVPDLKNVAAAEGHRVLSCREAEEWAYDAGLALPDDDTVRTLADHELRRVREVGEGGEELVQVSAYCRLACRRAAESDVLEYSFWVPELENCP